MGELPVALVVARNAHDRTGAVPHQHVVGDPDRHLLLIARIDRIGPGEDPRLPRICPGTLDLALESGLGDIGIDRFSLFIGGDHADEGMFRRKHAEGRAEHRVGASGEDLQFRFVPVDGEGGIGTFRTTDPIALHRLDRLGEADLFEPLQETVCVGGDPQHPLLHRLANHLVAAALALAIDHFIVGENGTQLGAPVDIRFFPIGEPILEQFEKNPLGPVVIARIGGREFPIPVVGESHRLELGAVHLDVLACRDIGVNPPLDRVLLRRQAERIPAHRMENVETLHPLEASDDVSRGVTDGMADVQPRPRWVGEHVEDVVFRQIGSLARLEEFLFLPVALPLRLDFLRVVGHRLAFPRPGPGLTGRQDRQRPVSLSIHRAARQVVIVTTPPLSRL